MDHHSSRRARSPPFGYDPGQMMDNREFAGPYTAFDASTRQHAMTGMGLPAEFGPAESFMHPYMEPSPRSDYPNYRENRLPSAYRHTMREPFPVAGPPMRPCSPSYKILCITNINNKIDDMSVKTALMSDFSRFGDISVSICHDSGERLAYIYFRNNNEAREARMTKARTLFFDRPIEIEPIYEPSCPPVDVPSPPPPYSQAAGMQQPVYSPRGRRSMTPPEYQYDINGQVPQSGHRRLAEASHAPMPHGPTPPMPVNHRPLSPQRYQSPLPAGYGSHGPSPPSSGPGPVLSPYDRREAYGCHYPVVDHMSPYSSPPPPTPHDQFRSYPSGQHYNQSPYSSGGAPPPPLSMSRVDRERMYPDYRYPSSRSPHASDPFYPNDSRGPHLPPEHPYNPPSRSSGHHTSRHRTSPVRHSSSRPDPYLSSATPAAYRHRPASPPRNYASLHSSSRPEPPMRFMSREYRRERYGMTDPHGGEQEDGRPSRVLLVNNIDSTKTESELKDIFESLGSIEELEMRKINSEVSSALIRFSSMDGAYKAKTANHGRYIGNSKCNIVYGKVSASRRLWIGGLCSSTTVPLLEDECSKYGDLVSMEYTSGRPYSYVEYETPSQAQFAAFHLKSTLVPAPDRKIRIEFVDPERSEKMSRHEGTSDTKSRTTNESWVSKERETSPQTYSGRKRSSTPSEIQSKRTCSVNDLPLNANTFKQERLAAAAAAKARTSSNSLTVENTNDSSTDQAEFNNNTSNQTGNGNAISATSHSSSERINECSRAGLDSPQEAPSQDILAQCSSIREIVSCCPVSWPSQIALRNFSFPSNIHLCSGRKQLIDKYLNKSNGDNGQRDQACVPLLRITQRWRLHPQPKLEEVKKRMQSGNLGMLIITSRQETPAVNSSSSDNKSLTSKQGHIVRNGMDNSETIQSTGSTQSESPIDNKEARIGRQNEMTVSSVSAGPNAILQQSQSNAQSRPLRNLISYLEQKDAAGVISLSASSDNEHSGGGSNSDANSKLLYAFPPGEFALNLIKRMACKLSVGITKEEFLLGVIVGGNVDGKA